MKHPYVKLAGALILLCALLFGYYQAIVIRINSGHEASVKRSIADKLDSIIEAMKSLDAERANTIEALSDRMLASAKLEAAMLRLSADYGKRAVREHGMVVRLRDGGIVYPAGSSVRFDDYDALFKNPSEVYLDYIKDVDDDTPRQALLCACQVKGDEYYVSWADGSDEMSLFAPNNEKQSELMTSVEISHGGYFLDVIELNRQLVFDYKSQTFASYETPEAMGITREVLEARPAVLEIDGKLYHSAFKTIREGEETGVFLILQSNLLFQTGSEAVIITALVGVILISVMAWLLATQRFVMDKILTKPMQHRYRPSKMRWMTLVLGASASWPSP